MGRRRPPVLPHRRESLAVRWSDALIADAAGIADYYTAEFGAADRADRLRRAAARRPWAATGSPSLGLTAARLPPRRRAVRAREPRRPDRRGLPPVRRHAAARRRRLRAVRRRVHRADRRRAADDRVRLLGGVWDQDLLDQLYAHCLHVPARAQRRRHQPVAAAGDRRRRADRPRSTSSFNREVLGAAGPVLRDARRRRAARRGRRAGPGRRGGARGGLRRRAADYDWDDVADAYEDLCRSLAAGAFAAVPAPAGRRRGRRPRRAARPVRSRQSAARRRRDRGDRGGGTAQRRPRAVAASESYAETLARLGGVQKGAPGRARVLAVRQPAARSAPGGGVLPRRAHPERRDRRSAPSARSARSPCSRSCRRPGGVGLLVAFLLRRRLRVRLRRRPGRPAARRRDHRRRVARPPDRRHQGRQPAPRGARGPLPVRRRRRTLWLLVPLGVLRGVVGAVLRDDPQRPAAAAGGRDHARHRRRARPSCCAPCSSPRPTTACSAWSFVLYGATTAVHGCLHRALPGHRGIPRAGRALVVPRDDRPAATAAARRVEEKRDPGFDRGPAVRPAPLARPRRDRRGRCSCSRRSCGRPWPPARRTRRRPRGRHEQQRDGDVAVGRARAQRVGDRPGPRHRARSPRRADAEHATRRRRSCRARSPPSP